MQPFFILAEKHAFVSRAKHNNSPVKSSDSSYRICMRLTEEKWSLAIISLISQL